MLGWTEVGARINSRRTFPCCTNPGDMKDAGLLRWEVWRCQGWPDVNSDRARATDSTVWLQIFNMGIIYLCASVYWLVSIASISLSLWRLFLGQAGCACIHNWSRQDSKWLQLCAYEYLSAYAYIFGILTFTLPNCYTLFHSRVFPWVTTLMIYVILCGIEVLLGVFQGGRFRLFPQFMYFLLYKK